MWLSSRHNSRTGRDCRGVGLVARAGVSEVLSQIADGVLAIPPTAFGAVGVMGLVGAALFVADPEKRLVLFHHCILFGPCNLWINRKDVMMIVCARGHLAMQ